MRSDVLIEEVLAKCDVLKKASFWVPEPRIRPRAWILNFDDVDRRLAALLLDRFTFYNHRFTDSLLVASYHSIGDGLPKGPNAPSVGGLLGALPSAAFSPVTGEHPNPTDSGYLLCRKARQLLGIPEDLIVQTHTALDYAYKGRPIVFLDDFVGSGDQFLTTWNRVTPRGSFADAMATTGFVAIYITLVTTDWGLKVIHRSVPEVAVCAAHVLKCKNTVAGLVRGGIASAREIRTFLSKYAQRLVPKEDYIANNPAYLMYGYKKRGLLFGFEHSIPDATLPIFWSPGNNNWEPLVARN